MDWIKLTPDNLPPLREDVLVVRPPKQGGISKKPIINIAYLVEYKKGERIGFLDGETVGDNKVSLREGGMFWAFPALNRLEDVSHWMPLPPLP
jgi:hypothetical protein